MKNIITTYISLVAVILLFGGQPIFAGDKMTQAHEGQDPAQVMKILRDKILKLFPKEINVSSSNEYPNVWGILMETGFPEGVATLVPLADGTVSLYFSGGGGVIGGGDHSNVRKEARKFIQSAEHYRKVFKQTKIYPLPNIG
jgi:hypothetical protein